MPTDIIFSLIVLIFSTVLHEVAHGYVADAKGDPTARLMGRLTLNPIPHIDPMGSIILPLILRLSGSPILIGYAKPVPYNPFNLKGKYAETLVALAGPATNGFIALIFGTLIRFGSVAMTPSMLAAFSVIVYINILLAVFNLIPIPPLDGSKVLAGILPRNLAYTYDLFRKNFERLGVLTGTLLLLALFYVFSPYFTAAISYIFLQITGLPV